MASCTVRGHATTPHSYSSFSILSYLFNARPVLAIAHTIAHLDIKRMQTVVADAVDGCSGDDDGHISFEKTFIFNMRFAFVMGA